MRHTIRALIAVVLVTASVAAQDKAEKELTFGIKDRGLSNNLQLYSPVPVHGPYPYLLYTARAGDVVQLQISYPIYPPFPKTVRVTYDPRFIKPLDGVNTGGEVAILEAGNPKEGVIGLGYLSIYLKAIQSGTTHLDAQVVFDDGDSETVPFNFKIGPERKTATHGLASSNPKAKKDGPKEPAGLAALRAKKITGTVKEILSPKEPTETKNGEVWVSVKTESGPVYWFVIDLGSKGGRSMFDAVLLAADKNHSIEYSYATGIIAEFVSVLVQ